MKRTLFLAVLCTIFVACAQQAPDWAKLNRYAAANACEIQSGNRRDVIFLGNSITDFWPRESPAFFEIHNYLGRGISGQTTEHFLVRIDSDVIPLHPRAVAILAGTNDIAENMHPYTEDTTFGNIVRLADKALAAGIIPIICAVPPAAEFPWHKALPNIPEKIISLNSRLEAYCRDNGIAWVDYYTPLVADDGRAMHSDYTGDGVHPNHRGYQVMQLAIQPVIEKVLAEK